MGFGTGMLEGLAKKTEDGIGRNPLSLRTGTGTNESCDYLIKKGLMH